MVTSTGDLQIVQVHQSDSGTYVCVADNGLSAPVEREVELTISGEFPFLNYFQVWFWILYGIAGKRILNNDLVCCMKITLG